MPSKIFSIARTASRLRLPKKNPYLPAQKAEFAEYEAGFASGLDEPRIAKGDELKLIHMDGFECLAIADDLEIGDLVVFFCPEYGLLARNPHLKTHPTEVIVSKIESINGSKSHPSLPFGENGFVKVKGLSGSRNACYALRYVG